MFPLFLATLPPPTNFRKSYPDPKLANNWGLLFSTFHVEQPEMLIEWKFESITDGGGYLRTDGGGYLWTDGGGYLWTD